MTTFDPRLPQQYQPPTAHHGCDQVHDTIQIHGTTLDNAERQILLALGVLTDHTPDYWFTMPEVRHYLDDPAPGTVIEAVLLRLTGRQLLESRNNPVGSPHWFALPDSTRALARTHGLPRQATSR